MPKNDGKEEEDDNSKPADNSNSNNNNNAVDDKIDPDSSIVDLLDIKPVRT